MKTDLMLDLFAKIRDGTTLNMVVERMYRGGKEDRRVDAAFRRGDSSLGFGKDRSG